MFIGEYDENYYSQINKLLEFFKINLMLNFFHEKLHY